ncbi:MAG TPA: hypothetical protein VJH91_02895 [Candidatus Paceibacterota bacterium]
MLLTILQISVGLVSLTGAVVSGVLFQKPEMLDAFVPAWATGPIFLVCAVGVIVTIASSEKKDGAT